MIKVLLAISRLFLSFITRAGVRTIGGTITPGSQWQGTLETVPMRITPVSIPLISSARRRIALSACVIYGISSGLRANYDLMLSAIAEKSGVAYASVSYVMGTAQ